MHAYAIIVNSSKGHGIEQLPCLPTYMIHKFPRPIPFRTGRFCTKDVDGAECAHREHESVSGWGPHMGHSTLRVLVSIRHAFAIRGHVIMSGNVCIAEATAYTPDCWSRRFNGMYVLLICPMVIKTQRHVHDIIPYGDACLKAEEKCLMISARSRAPKLGDPSQFIQWQPSAKTSAARNACAMKAYPKLAMAAAAAHPRVPVYSYVPETRSVVSEKRGSTAGLRRQASLSGYMQPLAYA